MPHRLALTLTAAFLILATSLATAQAPPVEKRGAENEIKVERNVIITVRDGTKLAADVYRPVNDGKYPTLLTRTPYNKGDGNSAEAKFYATRGYAVVMNDVRGRYASEGTWDGLKSDPTDGYDVVEWIAAQSWSNGKVGTFGTSYPGGTQHALAEMNPPHLTTMIPIDALSNCGVAGMRHGGAFELRFFNWIINIGAPNSRAANADPALKAALVENGRRVRQLADALPIRPGNTALRAVPEYEAWIVEALRSGSESPFWKKKGLSVVDHINDYADVPVQHVTGWYDSWTRQVTMNYDALHAAKKSPQRLLIGPWVHASQGSNVSGEVEFTTDAAIDLLAYRLRWYDHWLKQQPNGVDKESPVRIYVMGTGDDRKTPNGRLRHGGFWREEQEWPLKRATEQTFYFRTGGSLNAEPPARDDKASIYVFDPRKPVPTIGGNISSNAPLMNNGGYDQRPRPDTHAATDALPLSTRNDVLVFRTEPLSQDAEVTGTVVAELYVATSCLDTDFTAKLIDEIPANADYPTGYDLNIGDSILRLRYRDGFDKQVIATPGEIYKIRIPLYPTSNVFKRGHRIRVDISSSNYPRFDVNPNTGEALGDNRTWKIAENLLYHDERHPSRVILPVIPVAVGDLK